MKMIITGGVNFYCLIIVIVCIPLLCINPEIPHESRSCHCLNDSQDMLGQVRLKEFTTPLTQSD